MSGLFYICDETDTVAETDAFGVVSLAYHIITEFQSKAQS